jgi:predicted phage baseplate assembly protein
MTLSVDPTLRNLNDCGCCEGLAPATPQRTSNRPGLSAIAYRVGTHAQFKETMLARLSESGLPALRGLKTRDDDDFTIALLDAWATVADVLTFYQERIASEFYLRTASERVSLLELARLIGYELRPGVAASACLAFTIEDPPGATRQTSNALGVPRSTTIDAGVKVQSIPGPGEQAQTFETIEQIEARIEWNAIRPRLTTRHPIKGDASVLYFAGFATGLKKGDGVLLTPDDGGDPVFRQVAEVKLDEARQRTEVRLQPLPSAVSTGIITSKFGFAFSPAPITSKFIGKTISAPDFKAISLVSKFSIADIFDNLTAVAPPPPGVLAFRTRASIFGHNAPKWETLPVSQRIGEFGPNTSNNPPTTGFIPGQYSTRQNSWAEEKLSNYHDEPAGTRNIYLDNVLSTIVEDSRVVLKDGDTAKPYKVEKVAEVSKSDFTLSAKVTRLTLDSNNGFSSFSIRNTTVFAQSEELALARLPIETPVMQSVIELDGFIDGLFAGQKIIVCGELDQVRGVSACELAVIDKVEQVLQTDGFTRLTLHAALANSYVREAVTINANVALATHGETVQGIPGINEEILGSGDATQIFQRFTLRQPPLTYTSAATPSGAQTTLEVRVNDLLWHEVPGFFGHGPDERIYITRTDDAGNTTVIFGDGKTGARLPTGQQNVRARYRKGIGLAGNVKANQLSQLMTRPLGVKGAINPMAAGGAADPESRDEARRNAPLTVLTLGRIVSLQDYEDFARAFAGIDKALATWAWHGERRVVFVTVAGSKGAEVRSDSTLYQNLLKAMLDAGDPNVPLIVQSYEPRLFQLAAAVKVDADFLPEKVLATVEQRLREQFSFDARNLGQPVSLSEVVAVMQNVRGVVAVEVNAFFASDPNITTASALKQRLEARMPRAGGDQFFAAELLTLDPRPVALEVMK